MAPSLISSSLERRSPLPSAHRSPCASPARSFACWPTGREETDVELTRGGRRDRQARTALPTAHRWRRLRWAIRHVRTFVGLFHCRARVYRGRRANDPHHLLLPPNQWPPPHMSGSHHHTHRDVCAAYVWVALLTEIDSNTLSLACALSLSLSLSRQLGCIERRRRHCSGPRLSFVK